MPGVESATGLTNRQRIAFVDFFKAVFIVLVVITHITFANGGVNSWARSFTMSAIFFASGFMRKKEGAKSGRELLSAAEKSFRRLMVPYYLWAAIYMVPTFSNIAWIIYGSYTSLDKSGTATILWFLPVMFLSVLFYELLCFLLRDKMTSLVKLVVAALSFAVARVLPTIELGYPLSFNVAFTGFGFLLLGNVCFPLIQSFYTFLLSKGKALQICIPGALAVASCVVTGLLNNGNIPYIASVLMADARYGHYGLFLLASLTGLVFVTAAAILLERLPLGRVRGAISYLGQNTFAVYTLHKAVIQVMRMVFRHIAVPSWAALVITCAIALAASCLGGWAINRYAPVLVGKRTTDRAAT